MALVITILLASSHGALATALEGRNSATVEAEFGAETVKGSYLTMAHHGANAGNPCPCSYSNVVANGFVTLDSPVIGVSHFDLDTLGGVAALIGIKSVAPTFWALAEFVDLNGAHKLSQSGASEEDLAMLHAWWAWNESHKVFSNRDGSVRDVTSEAMLAIETISKIVGRDADLLAAGEAFRAAEKELNVATKRRPSGRVLVRNADQFVNHLYSDANGVAYDAVVAYNSKFRSVTVSFATTRDQDDACKFVQSIWGSLAGGHKGIAGSPRGVRMSMRDAKKAAKSLSFLMSR